MAKIFQRTNCLLIWQIKVFLSGNEGPCRYAKRRMAAPFQHLPLLSGRPVGPHFCSHLTEGTLWICCSRNWGVDRNLSRCICLKLCHLGKVRILSRTDFIYRGKRYANVIFCQKCNSAESKLSENCWVVHEDISIAQQVETAVKWLGAFEFEQIMCCGEAAIRWHRIAGTGGPWQVWSWRRPLPKVEYRLTGSNFSGG